MTKGSCKDVCLDFGGCNTLISSKKKCQKWSQLIATKEWEEQEKLIY